MDRLLGLPGLIVHDVVETFTMVSVTAEVEGGAPTCSSCGTGIPMSPHGSVESKFWDAPMRGKKCRLLVRRRRFICSCGKTISLDVPAIAEEEFSGLTTRLARYIKNQSFRRPMSAIAAEVGASPATVTRLVNRLAIHLHDAHKFPTPEVLGIDDLRIRKRLFTVVTDATTGYPVALVDGGKELMIRREMHRREIDVTKVKVVVSDMGGSNIAVFKNLFKQTPAIHVADMFHVLKGVNEALGLVINRRLDRLRRRRSKWEKWLETQERAAGAKRAPAILAKLQSHIETLRSAKDHLLGARIRKRDDEQPILDVDTIVIAPICARYPEIGKAFWSKIRLHQVYAVSTRQEAEKQIDRFLARASSRSIVSQIKVIVERVKKHRDIILNYHDALAVLGGSYERVPTTGPTEQRNGTIKGAWSAARGFNSHEAFSLRALYEPWRIDIDIAICWADRQDIVGADGKPRATYCKDVTGPFPGLAQSRAEMVVPPLHRHRCDRH
jgi:transposase